MATHEWTTTEYPQRAINLQFRKEVPYINCKWLVSVTHLLQNLIINLEVRKVQSWISDLKIIANKAPFQVFNSHLWLVAATLDKTETENISTTTESSVGQHCSRELTNWGYELRSASPNSSIWRSVILPAYGSKKHPDNRQRMQGTQGAPAR